MDPPPLPLPLPLPFLFFLVLLASCPVRPARSEPTQDRAALSAFLAQTPHEPRVQWSASSSACVWVGVTCDANRTAVLELRLPGVGFVGPIPAGTLGRLASLRVLSLRSNRLSGAIPDDLAGLSLLRSLYLQDNNFSGSIPPAFGRLARLSRLDLSGNSLSGPIPFALNNLTRLTTLQLERNQLSGSLPSISIGSLQAFNVSDNRLNGSIPKSLSGFPAASFAGNLDLCGAPLPPCSPFFPAPAPSPVPEENPARKSKRKLSKAAIVAIAVGCSALVLLVLVLLICLAYRLRKDRQREKAGKGPAPGARSGETGMTSSSKEDIGAAAAGAAEAEKNRLVFVGKGAGYSFDLEDLLRASAEVLGKGSVGTSYKAVLEEGTTVVVKRLKDVTANKREFELHMEALGRVDHQNLLPVRAYYYSKDEKLLVFDHLPTGSLSSLLHGSRGSGRTPLDWDSRMRVALAAGRGLAHLHSRPNLAHGNLKASNVLLRPDLDAAALSDFTLFPLFSNATPPNRIAGYRAPEILETRRPTFKSDVYSFGVLLLELLTGKAPNQASFGEEGIDLPRWVQSVVREEWTAEVFDVELVRHANVEEEMVQLLQISMACVATVPDARPEIAEVVRMMEDIVNRPEGDDATRGTSYDLPKSAGSSVPIPPGASTP